MQREEAAVCRTAPPLLPGVGLCVLVTAVAYGLQTVEIERFGRPWLEALVFAILLGVAARTLWTPGGVWRAGIESAPRPCWKSRSCCWGPR